MAGLWNVAEHWLTYPSMPNMQNPLTVLIEGLMYSNLSISTVNGSCRFAVLIESVLIKVKNKGD